MGDAENADENVPDVEPTDAISTQGSDMTISESATTEVSVDHRTIAASYESIPAIHSYQIKPTLQDRFKAGPVREIIRMVQSEILGGKSYEAESVKKWTITIANEVSARVIELKMNRYKHIVQVVLGEHKGAGVKAGLRCLWDSETDAYTSEVFSSDALFCLTVVYAIYLY